ncbi:hypothetical protein [Carboxylicivirga linearis]|uniref:Transposase n=1 Tax=Carboxylicivirga linearis TaxID=1628157 RepID=A0ABS5K2D6_9BACT|nr:hypothetical protein [Carboxylicivirga linearis]MBS2100676.1 hypothetical protein [Carboxylicivirga linearis]
MPQLWLNNKVAVEKNELVSSFYKERNLAQELWRYKNKPYGIKRLQKGGNGRKLLIDFDTLPREIQEALGDPRKVGHILERYYRIDSDTVEYYGDYKRPHSGYLTTKEQEQYIVNASVMHAVVRLEQDRIIERRNKRGSLRGLGSTLCTDVITFNETLKVRHKVTHNIPSNDRRFKEYLKAFKMEGLYSIIKDPMGTGRQNARKVDNSVLEIIKGLFIDGYKPTATEIARNYEAFLSGYAEVYNEKTGELYNPKDFPKLSESTVKNYLAQWEHKIGTHKKRSGNRQTYIANYIPHGQMDLPKKAGSMISIDDRQPPFWYEKGKRMWFYIGMDVASGCITTFVYGKSKEGIIVDFYRQMVRFHAEYNLGLPIELECESSLNSSFKNTILREGNMFKHVRIEANNAQGKIIERRFGAIRYEVEKKAPGWIARPFAKKESNQAGPGDNMIIPYDELVAARLSEIEDWNNSPHHENNELSKWEYFLQNQHEETNHINYKAILPHIGYSTQTSCHRGYITLQGRKRAIAENGKILTGSSLIEKMKVIEGKDVEVRWLDSMNGEVLKAYAYIDDRFMCEVIEMPRFNRAKAEQTKADKAAMELQSHYAMTVIGYAQTTAKQIEKVGFNDLSPKPERKFQIPNLKRYEANEEFAEVEILDEVHPDDNEILYNQNSDAPSSWRDNFLK